MNVSQSILSEITVFNKYAKFLPEFQRRENWTELCMRNKNMHLDKYPESGLGFEINRIYNDYVLTKKILPSMRSMQFGGRPIELSNNRMFNCFSRDTEFITSHGTKSFQDYEHGDQITVKTHLGNWKSATVKKYGKQNLNLVTFTRGNSEKKVRVTPNHRCILKNGQETTNLSLDDSLYGVMGSENFDYDNALPLERLYWCYGYVFGDGTTVKNSAGDYKYSLVRLCGGDKAKFAYRFDEMGFKSSEPLSCGGDPFYYTGTYLKTAPDLEVDSIEMASAFLDGYLCADAGKSPNWYKNNTLSKYSCIMSADLDHNEFLSTALELCGYYITDKKDISHEVTNYGPRKQGSTRYGITNNIGMMGKSNGCTHWRVTEIEEAETEEVWCLEVEDDHSFILSGGLTTGNCAYLAVDNPAAFWETMFLLLGGSGVGYSVQKQHVAMLPEVKGPSEKKRRFLVGDSIEGWADAIKVTVRAYFEGKSDPELDYRDIRRKGAKLVTSGGKAPGPDPLRICIAHIRAVMNNAIGRNLTTIECHDMMCHIADAVLSGGIRRAALIALFSEDDLDMLSSKSGSWWESSPQRGRANNSIALKRGTITETEFKALWSIVEASKAGEPGIFWTNDYDIGTNPCISGDALVTVCDHGVNGGVGTPYKIPMKLLVDICQGQELLPCALSLNTTTGELEWKQITAAAMTRKAAEVLKITYNGKSVVCTPDHKIYTTNRGWVEAKDLVSTDSLYSI